MALLVYAPVGKADVGGEVPAPGLCEYPFVGHSMMVGAGPAANVYVYVCDGPTEENGAHWHAELGGEATTAAVQAGVSMMFVNASVSASGNLGFIGGVTGWRCPDNTEADWPNPPGAWKNKIHPSVCKSIGPTPLLPGQSPPPPPPTNDSVAAGAEAVSPSNQTPAVTDPTPINPISPANPGR
jgi:hypothetical protein